MKKICFLWMLILFLAGGLAFAQTGTKQPAADNVRLSNLFPKSSFKLDHMPLQKSLQLAEHYYRIPICYELLADKWENEAKLITMENNGMNLKEFLNCLVSIRPEYKWAQIGPAVVVYPRSDAKTDMIIDCTFEADSLHDLYKQINARIKSSIQNGDRVGILIEGRDEWIGDRFTMQRPIRLEKGRINLRECLCLAVFLDEDLQIKWAYVPGGDLDLIVIHFYVGGLYAGGDNVKEYLEKKKKKGGTE